MIMDIVISVYNKEKTILNYYNKLIEELKDLKYRIIFVDDNSSDKTLEVLKSIQKDDEAKVKIISLSKTQGKDTCIYAGLRHVTHPLACIIDLDLNANVSYVTKMYDYITTHDEYDSVCMYSNYEEKSFLKRTKIKLLNKLYDLNINNNKTYYRIIRKNVIDALHNINKNYPFNNYSFELLGFNTYYMKFDNNNINNDNLNKYICFTTKPYNLFKSINYALILILFVLFVLSLLKVFTISTNILLLIIILFNIINLSLLDLSIKLLNKEKTYYLIKEKIGFDENVL